MGENLNSLYTGWRPWTASAWAKLDNDEISARKDSLSLVAHLADAALTADWLWGHFVAISVRDKLAELLGGEDAAHAAVTFAAGVHDIGKASPPFAIKARLAGHPEATSDMERAGFRFPVVRHDAKHALVGQVVVEDWLKNNFDFSIGIARSIAVVVGGHHGRFPSKDELKEARKQWWVLSNVEREDASSPSLWHQARVEILERVSEASGADHHFPGWRSTGWPVEAQMLITAIVILADWLASNVDFFPYGEARPGRLEDALPSINLPGAWRATEPGNVKDLFAQRFPNLADSKPSPLQAAAATSAQECASSPLMIIEAPMGAGKTEAAQLAAEVLAAKFGSGGVFIGLPTMATANPMFDRTLKWLDNTLTSDASVMLAHSKSGHHDSFQALLEEARFRSVHDEEDGGKAAAVAAWWLMGRKKATQASFVVGTVDQLLLMALQAKHVSLRHLAMAGKVVIIDEVHAADHYMRVYLKRALTWLARMGVPVILMSATLPPQQRQEFVDAYLEGRGQGPPSLPDSESYPRITLVEEQAQTLSVPPDTRTSQVRFLPMRDENGALIGLLQNRLAEGGCAAVIRNTVSRAQQIFDELDQQFPGEVVLLHSRFIAQHRAARERGLVNALGPEGKRPHRLIVVGTQVLEQSLDVDFDLMVSDLAPMDLLLQRAGRLHRHNRPTRPALVSSAECYVTGADFTQIPPAPDKWIARVYGKAGLFRAAALLPSDGLVATFPDDIPRLVKEAYDPNTTPPDGWGEAWKQADDTQRAKIYRQEDRASYYLIHAPDERETLVDSSKFDATDPESPRSTGKQQVRDAADSMEVIVLIRDSEGFLRLPEGIDQHNRVIPEYSHADIPNDLARLMSASTVSLPFAMTISFDRFDEVEAALSNSLDYSNWDRSPWLKGQLALVLDSNGTVDVAQFRVSYDTRKGLTHTMEEPNT